MATVIVYRATPVPNVTILALQTGMVRTAPTSAVVPHRHLLVVTRAQAPASANQALEDHAVISHALLASGV